MKGEKRKLSLQMPKSRKPRKEIKGCSLLNHPKSGQKVKLIINNLNITRVFILLIVVVFQISFFLHKKTFYFN